MNSVGWAYPGYYQFLRSSCYIYPAVSEHYGIVSAYFINIHILNEHRWHNQFHSEFRGNKPL